MSPGRQLFRLEDKLSAEGRLLEALGHPSERRIIVASVGAALAVHAVLLVIPAPHRTAPEPEPLRRPDLLEVLRWMPAPPGAAAVAPTGRPAARRDVRGQPLPAASPPPPPTPARPEPVAEPTVFDSPIELPHEAETLSAPATMPEGDDAAPAASASPPSVAAGGATRPKYPLMARALRAEGFVLVEVQVARDGSVEKASVVRCSRPGVGFEEAAVAAVRKWRFNPGMRDGEAVVSTLVVKVEFTW